MQITQILSRLFFFYFIFFFLATLIISLGILFFMIYIMKKLNENSIGFFYS